MEEDLKRQLQMNDTERRDKLRQIWIDRWRLEGNEGEELGSEGDWGRIDRRLRYFDTIGNEVLLPPHVDPREYRLGSRFNEAMIESDGHVVQAWIFQDIYGNLVTIPYLDVEAGEYLVPSGS